MVFLTIILVQVLCCLYQSPKYYIEIWHERPFSLQEQAQEWVAVLSKRSKKALKKISPLKPRKRVRFADHLVSNSPPVKHVPAFDVETIVFGSLPPVMCEKAVQSVPDLSRSSGDVPTHQIFGKL